MEDVLKEATDAINEEHSRFIDDIIQELNAKGVSCGRTSYSTPRCKDMNVWRTDVIAKKKSGWHSRLPYGRKYDTSKEAILLRIYDPLESATVDPLVKSIVEEKSSEYFSRISQIAESYGLKLRENRYSLIDDIMYRKGFRSLPAIRLW